MTFRVDHAGSFGNDPAQETKLRALQPLPVSLWQGGGAKGNAGTNYHRESWTGCVQERAIVFLESDKGINLGCPITTDQNHYNGFSVILE